MQTIWELEHARTVVTARYRKLENAVNDGYVDINGVVPNMGYHSMEAALALWKHTQVFMKGCLLFRRTTINIILK